MNIGLGQCQTWPCGRGSGAGLYRQSNHRGGNHILYSTPVAMDTPQLARVCLMKPTLVKSDSPTLLHALILSEEKASSTCFSISYSGDTIQVAEP